MYRVESLKLFGDISKVSDKYKSWHLKDDENEIKDNRKLKTLLNYHNSRFDHIKEKYDFLPVLLSFFPKYVVECFTVFVCAMLYFFLFFSLSVSKRYCVLSEYHHAGGGCCCR